MKEAGWTAVSDEIGLLGFAAWKRSAEISGQLKSPGGPSARAPPRSRGASGSVMARTGLDDCPWAMGGEVRLLLLEQMWRKRKERRLTEQSTPDWPGSKVRVKVKAGQVGVPMPTQLQSGGWLVGVTGSERRKGGCGAGAMKGSACLIQATRTPAIVRRVSKESRYPDQRNCPDPPKLRN